MSRICDLVSKVVAGIGLLSALNGCSETKTLDFDYKGTHYDCTCTLRYFTYTTEVTVTSSNQTIQYEGKEKGTKTLTVPRDQSFTETEQIVNMCLSEVRRFNHEELYPKPSENLDEEKNE